MRYSEGFETGNPYREAYLASINKLISSKESDCRDSRKRLAYEIMADKALGLEKLKATLGWPLTLKNNKGIPCVRQELVSQEDGYCVYRMQIEVFPDFWFYGNFFKHTDDNVRPFVISQHGGDGSPELCSGMLDSGTGNYNRMTERILSHGINVFAPQLLLWKEEIFNLPNNRKSIHAALEGIGGTITALEVFCIQRTIDYFEAQAYQNDIYLSIYTSVFFTLHSFDKLLLRPFGKPIEVIAVSADTNNQIFIVLGVLDRIFQNLRRQCIYLHLQTAVQQIHMNERRNFFFMMVNHVYFERLV